MRFLSGPKKKKQAIIKMFTVHANCKKAGLYFRLFFFGSLAVLGSSHLTAEKKSPNAPKDLCFICLLLFFNTCSCVFFVCGVVCGVSVCWKWGVSRLAAPWVCKVLLPAALKWVMSWTGLRLLQHFFFFYIFDFISIWNPNPSDPIPLLPARLHILGHRLIKGSTIPSLYIFFFWRNIWNRARARGSLKSAPPRLEAWVFSFQFFL